MYQSINVTTEYPLKLTPPTIKHKIKNSKLSIAIPDGRKASSTFVPLGLSSPKPDAMKFRKTLSALIVTCLFISINSTAQLRVPFDKAQLGIESRGAFNVQGFIPPDTMAHILLGPGINLISASYIGTDSSMGTFVDSTQTLGIDSGIVICSGSIFNIPGPNTSGGTGTVLNLPSDPDLAVLCPGYTINDAVILELFIQPLSDTLIATEMIFGSEEYPEYVASSFNDVFGFFLDGPGYYNENIALIPGTNLPITINNVNHIVNTNYYVDNTGGNLIEYDGYTIPIPIVAPVQVNTTYRLKIAVADAGDFIYDSGVFLKKHSLVGFAQQPVAAFNHSINGLDLTLNNYSQRAKYYELDLGDGTVLADSNLSSIQHTYPGTGSYSIRLIAHNFYKSDTSEYLLNITSTDIQDHQNTETRMINSGNGQLEFDLAGAEAAQLQVFDSFGRLVQTTGIAPGTMKYRVDINSLLHGHYIIRLTQGNDVSTFKAFAGF